MLVSSLPPNTALLSGGGNHARTLSNPLPPGNNSSYLPYLVNGSEYPTAVPLPNSTDNVSLPQLQSVLFENQTLFVLIYLDTDWLGNHHLEARTGAYDPAVAAAGLACPSSCNYSLPLTWTAPTTVANFGTTPVSGDALAASGSAVAVAVASQGRTKVFYSDDLGANGTWSSITGSSPISGDRPRLVLVPCGILVTSITPGATVATTIPFSCRGPVVNPPSGGGGGRQTPNPAPSVSSVSPNNGPSGILVAVNGSNFYQSGLSVAFHVGGSVFPSPIVGYVSSTQLTVQVPSGPVGPVVADVVVTDVYGSSTINPGDQFTYPPPPTVTGVSPTSGGVGTSVSVTGTNYYSGALVDFGTTPASGVTFVSSTQLTATAPTGSGTVDVRVTVGSQTSPPNPPSDQFTLTGTAPTVTGVVPWEGPAGTNVQVNGTNFQPTASVSFGGTPAGGVTYISSTQLDAIAPAGTGTVDITVTVSSLTSSPNPFDQFSYPPVTSPLLRSSVSLPLAYAAAPVWLNGTEGILASDVNTSHIVSYNSTNGKAWYADRLNSFSGDTESSVFSSIGGTRLETPNGTVGDVAAVSEGPDIFGLYTTTIFNRTVVESLTSSDAGVDWNSTFPAAATVGSVDEPALAASPAGYVFATWRENGGGSWQVDEEVYTVTGEPVAGPYVLPGSVGSNSGTAAGPTVASDGLERPLFAWTTINSSVLYSNIVLTGDFLSPIHAAQTLRSSFDLASPTDFWNVTPANLQGFRTSVDAYLDWLVQNATAKAWCDATTLAARYVYPNVTALPTAPALGGSPACPVSIGPSGQSLVLDLIGPLTANTSLAIQSQWLLEALGYAAWATPAWYGAPGGPAVPVGAASGGSTVPVSTPGSGSDLYASISVKPQAIDPNAIFLNTTPRFNSYPSSNGSRRCELDPTTDRMVCGFTGATYSDVASSYTTKVTLGSGSTQSYSGTSVYSVYVTNLTSQSTGTWTVSVTATWVDTKTTYVLGSVTGHSKVTPQSGWPSKDTVSASGTYSTYLGILPGGAPWVDYQLIGSGPGATADITGNWTNTMYANGTAYLNGSAPSAPTPLPPRVVNEKVAWTNQPTGYAYQLTAAIQSEPGGRNASWSPSLNSGQVGQFRTSPLSAVGICTFTVQSYALVNLSWNPSTIVSGITETDAVVTWTADENGSGFVDYKEAYGPSFEQNATEITLSIPSADKYEFIAHLHGLTPWGYYGLAIGVSVAAGNSQCAKFTQTADFTFNTTRYFQLEESDLPYDSITQQGGGSVVGWFVPSNVVNHGSLFNGTVTYYPTDNLSRTVQFPMLSPSTIPYSGFYWVNLSALTVDTVYAVSVQFNYTYAGLRFSAQGLPFTFHYAKDSSGDGLTDWEKVRGWGVTTTGLGGSVTHTWVQADPSSYATNGLTGDFVEKEFGLNPTTVDTAGSHMLDTWNLTFDLGATSGSPLPPAMAKLHYWNANSTYDPFPGGASTACGNLSDSSPWAATVLWCGSGTGNALSVFVGLSGVQNAGWLRAVFGTHGSERTLTIWGKLSWGANPLSTSTPGDGLADGARVNPLFEEGVQLDFGNLPGAAGGFWVNPNSTNNGCGNLPSGAGVALRFYAPGATDNFGGYNYSSQFNTCPGYNVSYSLTIPVDNTVAQQRVMVQLWANVSTGNSPQPELLPVNGCRWSYNVSVDMLNATPLVISSHADVILYGNPNQNCAGSGNLQTLLAFSYTEVPIDQKAPTFLWVPDDNSTLSPLPWGLTRYVGEQAFDLVVVNNLQSFSVTSDPIPLPWGGTMPGITLAPGLNNILLPRGAFLTSPLGEAIHEEGGTANASVTDPVLLGPSEGGAVVNHGAQGSLTNLACYIENRATYQAPSGCGGSYVGTANNTTKAILVLGNNTCTPTNCGGLPGNAGADPSNVSGAALQEVAIINLTAPAGIPKNELDVFLAGLLTNGTTGAVAGGVNGTLLDVTRSVGSLGLFGPVWSALANQTELSGGLYGAPTSVAQPPPPSSGSNFLGELWNVATGNVFIQTLSTWVGIAVSYAIIGLNYIIEGATWLGNFFLKAPGRAAHALQQFGQEAGALLNEFIQWVEHEAAVSLGGNIIGGQIVSPLVSPYGTPILNSIIGSGGGLANPLPPSAGDAMFGGILTSILPSTGIIIDAVGVALTIIDVLTLGLGTIVWFIVATVASLLSGSLANVARGSGDTDTSNAGSTLWSFAMQSGVNAINAGVSAAGKTLTSTEENNEQTALSDLSKSTSVIAKAEAFGAAIGAVWTSQGSRNSIVAGVGAAFSLALALGGLFVLLFLPTVSAQYQIPSSFGMVLAAFSTGTAILALIFTGLAFLRSTNLELKKVYLVMAGLEGVGLGADILDVIAHV